MVWVIHRVHVRLRSVIILSENIPAWLHCSCVKPDTAVTLLLHKNKIKAVIQSYMKKIHSAGKVRGTCCCHVYYCETPDANLAVCACACIFSHVLA